MNRLHYTIFGDPTATINAFDALTKKGADVVCAATINLTTATGDFVHITGNTGPIATITLAEGDTRVVVFDSTPTLTHSSTLMIGGRDIVAAANDVAVFRGDTSSVVRLVTYMRASSLATGSGITMTTARLLGRTTASTGAIEEISATSPLTLSGGALSFGTQVMNTVLAGPTSGANAAPTFRALVAADIPASASAMVLITSTTASNAASIAFTSGISSTYGAYLITLSNIVPQTDATDLYFTASTDGGSSYLTSYNSQSLGHITTAGAYANTQSATSVITLFGSLGNATGESFVGNFILSDPGNAVVYKNISGTTAGRRSDGNVHTGTICGEIPTATAINAIKFTMSSGNINGTISLYGIKKA